MSKIQACEKCGTFAVTKARPSSGLCEYCLHDTVAHPMGAPCYCSRTAVLGLTFVRGLARTNEPLSAPCGTFVKESPLRKLPHF